MDQRIENEKKHGQYVIQKGEEIWNWSSPAGKIRRKRRCDLFNNIIGNYNRKILEIGCGTGIFTKEFARSNNEIIAIDISEDLINLASERIKLPNLTFKIENAYQTNFEENLLDFIVGISVLHHLDIKKALKEFYRILKPGGMILFAEPNILNPQIAFERSTPLTRKLMNNSPDETAFLRWKISRQLQNTGFKEIRVIPFDFIHPSIPKFFIPGIIPILNSFEYIPFLREFAGSLFIKAEKYLNVKVNIFQDGRPD